MKKGLLTPVASLVFGIALLALILKLAGVQNIISSVKQFSPHYFIPFMAVTLALFAAATYRWKVVLDGEGAHVPFLTLLKYKLMVFGVNYLTPVARVGGEPFKIMLLRSQHVKSSKSFASIVLDNFIGMGFDAVIGSLFLIAIFFTSQLLPLKTRELLLATGITALAVVAASYFALTRRKGIFSDVLDIACTLTRASGKKFFADLIRKVAAAEFYIRNTLIRKPKRVLLVSFYAAIGWPLSILQYKFALLMLGVDASIAQIVVIIVVMTLTTIIPIPAALGVQEAGQFSVFKVLGHDPSLGIALSFVIRLKDVILLHLSFGSLSMEGFNFLRVVKEKIAESINGNGRKRKHMKRRKRK
ncbi:flippase-like domain-containing protein [Candidatus Woesearchaeota archaeon]|nr:flippase-like domain-containing protein [Candidatus Woesearchaeota archaeon]